VENYLIILSISFLICIIITRVIIRRILKDDMLYRRKIPKIDRTTDNVGATIIHVTDIRDQGIVGPTGIQGSFGITGATGFQGRFGITGVTGHTGYNNVTKGN
jgi:hypothetical protein